MRAFISQGRTTGVKARTRLGKIIQQLNGINITYYLTAHDEVHRKLTGRGTLFVEADADEH